MKNCKDSFSVRYKYLDSEENRLKRFGNMWFALPGDLLGDIEAVQIISLAGEFLQNILLRRQDFVDESIFHLPSNEVVRVIEGNIANSSSQQEAAYWESYFLAPGCGPSMDGEILVWLVGADHDRLIWKKFGSIDFMEAMIPSGCIREVLSDFVNDVI